MAQQRMSDRDLLAVWNDQRTTADDLNLLTPDEAARLETLVNATQPTPAVTTPTPAPPRGMFDTFGRTMTDVGVGAVKGVGKSAIGLGRMFSQLPGLHQLSEAIQPGAFEGEKVETALGVKPTNTAQMVGQTGEQVAEFFAPGGVVSRSVKGLGLLPRAIAEGATAAGVGAVQGDPSLATTAALGAAGPVVGAGVGRVLGRAASQLKASSAEDIQHALNPTTRRMKAKTTRITPEIQQRGITGSLEDVKAGATGERKALGEAIDERLLQKASDPVQVQSVREAALRELDSTQSLVPRGDGTTKVVVHNPRKAAQVKKFLGLLEEYGDEMTTEQAVAVRRTWDDLVAKAGGFDEKASGAFGVTLDDASEAGAVRPLVGELRKALAEAHPDVKVLNKEFKFWKDLEDVTSATGTRRVGQRRNLTRQIVRGGAMAMGGASGGGLAGGVLSGELAARAEKLFTSPKFKLLAAREKYRLAEALASGNQERIGSALGRTAAALKATTAQ